MRLNQKVCLLVFINILTGCQSYVNSTPRETYEGNNSDNYERVFKENIPDAVEVINSIIIGYSFRPGVVTTDDWEFELIAPYDWAAGKIKEHYLRADKSDFIKSEIERRMESPIRSWYAVKNIKAYNLYRDLSSVGYVHMLVSKTPTHGDRHHIYVSKH